MNTFAWAMYVGVDALNDNANKSITTGLGGLKIDQEMVAELLEQISEAGQVKQDAYNFARRLAAECAPLTLRAQKATLWQAVDRDEQQARDLSNERRTMIRQSGDYAEGRQVFMEKRTLVLQAFKQPYRSLVIVSACT